MLRKIVTTALVFGLACAAFGQSTARAQGIYPRNYAISCSGSACASGSPTCTTVAPVALVGRIQLLTPTVGIGSVAINADFSSVISPSASNAFAVTIVNGTAGPTSAGGNGIPVGCFAAAFKVANVPYLAATFACYSDTEHDFDLVPLARGSGATLSCHAKEM
jgi:hypothetical protein